MKKKYISPDLELLILEQLDIITNSPVSGDPGNPGGKDEGVWDGEGWD